MSARTATSETTYASGGSASWEKEGSNHGRRCLPPASWNLFRSQSQLVQSHSMSVSTQTDGFCERPDFYCGCAKTSRYHLASRPVWSVLDLEGWWGPCEHREQLRGAGGDQHLMLNGAALHTGQTLDVSSHPQHRPVMPVVMAWKPGCHLIAAMAVAKVMGTLACWQLLGRAAPTLTALTEEFLAPQTSWMFLWKDYPAIAYPSHWACPVRALLDSQSRWKCLVGALLVHRSHWKCLAVVAPARHLEECATCLLSPASAAACVRQAFPASSAAVLDPPWKGSGHHRQNC